MIFNHNDHYHRLLLRHVPPACSRALDVGCGTGRFARRLAAAGIATDAIDSSADVIRAARAISEQNPRQAQPFFRIADVAELALPPATYDYISCLASIHHMQFEEVSKLRSALTPGGVLVILGCYRSATWSDHVLSATAIPLNVVFRGVSAAWPPPHGRKHAHGRLQHAGAAARPAGMTIPEIRAQSRRLLPGYRLRRLLFWRYLLVYHSPRSKLTHGMATDHCEDDLTGTGRAN